MRWVKALPISFISIICRPQSPSWNSRWKTHWAGYVDSGSPKSARRERRSSPASCRATKQLYRARIHHPAAQEEWRSELKSIKTRQVAEHHHYHDREKPDKRFWRSFWRCRLHSWIATSTKHLQLHKFQGRSRLCCWPLDWNVVPVPNFWGQPANKI